MRSTESIQPFAAPVRRPETVSVLDVPLALTDYARTLEWMDDMVAAHVDLYVTGHAHSYERFAPQNANGGLDTTNGLTQLTVGTGGAFYTGIGTVAPNSQVRQKNLFGVEKLTLQYEDMNVA